MLSLGRAQAGLMLMKDAIDNIVSAFSYYESRGDVDRATAIALQGSSWLINGRVREVVTRTKHVSQFVGLIEEALE